jgi:pyruvate formate lyase activating enzyme
MKDWLFYRKSGGGVTLSGGEPTLQIHFARDLLYELQEQGVSTAIETSGCVEGAHLRTLLPYLSQVLYDLKHIDSEMHRSGTGVPNELIIKNLIELSKEDIPIIVRIPLIPGFNDNEHQLDRAFNFIRELGIREVHLLPYHSLGRGKYRALGREYTMAKTAFPNLSQIDFAEELGRTRGLNVVVGG